MNEESQALQMRVAAFTATAAGITLPEISGLSAPAIAAFWLSDPRARSVLNDQLALLLRAIVESRRIFDEPQFSFCPICADALQEYDRPLDLTGKGSGVAATINGHYVVADSSPRWKP